MTQIIIGKAGLTDKIISNIKEWFGKKHNKNLEIKILRTCTRERDKIIEIGEKLINELGKDYIYRKLGFKIFLKKIK